MRYPVKQCAMALLLLLTFTVKPAGASLPEDSCWTAFGLKRQSVNGTVYALMEYQGKLIVGGSLTIAHDKIANRIAQWDGADWSAIGDGLDRSALALTEYNGQIVAGTGSGVFIWDGDSWSTVGEMYYSYIRSVAVHNDVLIAAGSIFITDNKDRHDVIYWDGFEWKPLDSGLTASVAEFVTFDTSLFAATGAGLLQWNGTRWDTVDGFVSGSVSDLQMLNSELFVAGRMKVAGAIDSTRSLAAWNGSTWRTIPLSHPNQRISALGVYQGKLTIAGHWWDGNIPPDPGLIAILEDSTWTEVSMYSRSGGLPINELLEYNGLLYAGGSFRVADSFPTEFLASWDGSTWHRPGEGINGNINAIVSVGDQIIIGGEFTQVGDLPARRIAAWDGFQWHPIGDGFDSTVLDLAVYKGQLIAAGTFTRSGSDNIRGLALWDGSRWLPCKPDLTIGIPYLVLSGDNLIAGFGYYGRAYIWDGSIWDSTGVSHYSLLSAFGSFQGRPVLGTTAQVTWDVSQLEFWNGIDWESRIPGFNPGGIFDLYDDGDKLFIGGFAPNFSSWTGSSHTVYPDVGIGIHDICKYNGRIIVGTDDYWDEGFTDPLIHQWTGTSWRSLGSGVDANVNDMTVHKGSLIVVGSFGSAGGKVSPYIAAWTESVTDVPDDQPESVPSDFQLSQNYPNPFNPSTNIRFSLPVAGRVRLDIFNLLGKKVRTLADDLFTAGPHEVSWNGCDESGRETATGIYLYRLTAGNTALTKKMLLLK